MRYFFISYHYQTQRSTGFGSLSLKDFKFPNMIEIENDAKLLNKEITNIVISNITELSKKKLFKFY